MSERKFYKTTFQVEVISEEPVTNLTLDQVHYTITEGDSSGDFKLLKEEVMDGKQAADALKAQGSDPGFFQIDENGEDIDEF